MKKLIALFCICLTCVVAYASDQDMLNYAAWSRSLSFTPISELILIDGTDVLSESARSICLLLGDDLDSAFYGAVDASVPEGAFDILYLDSNHDGAFSADERTLITKSDKLPTSSPLPLRVTYFDGTTSELSVQIRISKKNWFWRVARRENTKLIWDSHEGLTACLYDIPSQKMPNGCFSDNGRDMLFIDLNQNGIFDKTGGERIFLLNTVQIGNKFWDVKANPNGNQVTLTPSHLKTGIGNIFFKFIAPDAKPSGQMTIQSSATRISINLHPKNKIIAPIGNYKINSFKISCTDTNKKAWRTYISPSQKLMIKEDQPAQIIIIGRQLEAKLRIPDKKKRGNKLSVNFKLYDSDKNKYGSFRCNNKTMNPRVTITAPDGAELASGKMEYG